MTRQKFSASLKVVLVLMVAATSMCFVSSQAGAEDRLDELERLSARARQGREELARFLKEQAELKRIAKQREDLERERREIEERKIRLKAIEKAAEEKEKQLEKERKEAKKRAEQEFKSSEEKGSYRGERYYKGTKYGHSSYNYRDSGQEWVKVNGRYVPSYNANSSPYTEIGGNVRSVGHQGRSGTFRGYESGGRGLSIGVRAKILRLDDPDRY